MFRTTCLLMLQRRMDTEGRFLPVHTGILQDRTGFFPAIPSPSPFPGHTVLLQAEAAEDGGAPQTRALAPQLCKGLATGVEVVEQGHPAQPQPPPGEGGWAGWLTAQAAPEKS